MVQWNLAPLALVIVSHLWYITKMEFVKMKVDERNNSLNLHYEDKVRPYIDLVDSLRSLGVEKDLNLPAIAVIGDQSSGKSSVLEALSGVALPRGTGIVTRCPLVLNLKRVGHDVEWSGTLIYKNQKLNLKHPAEVGDAVITAQNALAGEGKGISHEMITLEIESYDVPDLTLIDLPGIARVATGDQPVDIETQIKDLIETFIKRQETISLVVVPANIDIATTEALKMANSVDPQGQRTLGVLTKPDLVDKGAEETVVRTVNNEVIPLTKGYMMVKCRGQQDINNNMSLAKAQRKEKIFFEEHPHFKYLLEKGKATVSLLAKRLTKELVEHIVRSLSQLQKEIEIKIEQTENDLKQLGEDVPEEDDKRNRFLIMKIKTFNEVLIDVTRGEEDTQNSEPKFFSKIRAEFQQWKTLLDDKVSALGEDLDEYTRNSRGKELPGFLNYRMFEKMVKKHVQDLEFPAIILLNNITGIVQSSVNSVISSHFKAFPNLLRESEDFMEDLLEQERKNALMAVKSQFNMEKIVYSQDGLYSRQLGSINLQDILISDVKVMVRHLNAYFKITSDRLANQLPLIIQYHMLDQYFSQLQTTMMTMIGSQNAQKLLQEDPSVAHRRRNLMDRLERLVKARQALSKFVHSA